MDPKRIKEIEVAKQEVEERRKRDAKTTDWLVRTAAPELLRLIKENDNARLLENIPPITDVPSILAAQPPVDSVRDDMRVKYSLLHGMRWPDNPPNIYGLRESECRFWIMFEDSFALYSEPERARLRRSLRDIVNYFSIILHFRYIDSEVSSLVADRLESGMERILEEVGP